MTALLPTLSDWFAAKGWTLHPHQLEMLARAQDAATLLIAPTGGGKTLAGFLPTLAELGPTPPPGLHTLYVSPLKALTADIRRNLGLPIEGAGLKIRVEDRTGDTTYTQRRRQRADPPHILLTTPESLALLLSYEDAPRIFQGLQRVIIDEIHALAEIQTRRPARPPDRPPAKPQPAASPHRPLRHGRKPARPRPLPCP